MSVVQIIQSLLCLELDDIFIVNYVNNPACFWVCAQTVTGCYSFCGFVVGNFSGTIPITLNFFKNTLKWRLLYIFHPVDLVY